jgi:hypothetical protein
MVPVAASVCPHCGRSASDKALVCALCGHLLRREERTAASADPVSYRPELATPPPEHRPGAPSPARSDTFRESLRARPTEEETRRARLEPWFYFGLGIVTAPVFALTPMLKFMGWFIASLVHEMGHAAMAWTFGMPSIPAISLAGHAAAVHGEQQVFLVAMVILALAMGAWKWLEGAPRWIALALVLVVHPLLAFTSGKDFLFLLAGHGGELVFAILALWKALDGGFTDSKLERALYGTVGWFLVGKNVFLCFGLMTSASARAHYDENGSFGLTNDYLRLAHDSIGCSLEAVAALMLLASVLTVPAAILLWRLRLRATASDQGAELA